MDFSFWYWRSVLAFLFLFPLNFVIQFSHSFCKSSVFWNNTPIYFSNWCCMCFLLLNVNSVIFLHFWKNCVSSVSLLQSWSFFWALCGVVYITEYVCFHIYERSISDNVLFISTATLALIVFSLSQCMFGILVDFIVAYYFQCYPYCCNYRIMVRMSFSYLGKFL